MWEIFDRVPRLDADYGIEDDQPWYDGWAYQTYEERNAAMVSYHEVYKGSYLKKEDVGAGKDVTIEAVRIADMDDGPSLVAKLLEVDQEWVINKTNCRILEDMFGSDDSTAWLGKRVCLYNDRTVQYQGNVGGIRVREAFQGNSQALGYGSPTVPGPAAEPPPSGVEALLSQIESYGASGDLKALAAVQSDLQSNQTIQGDDRAKLRDAWVAAKQRAEAVHQQDHNPF